MNHLISEAKELFVQAILDILDASSDSLLKLPPSKWSHKSGYSCIEGICLEMDAGNKYLGLQLIPENVKPGEVESCSDFDYPIGDITYGESTIESHKKLLDFMESKSNESLKDDSLKFTNESLYVAAAEALMDSGVIEKLVEYNIQAKLSDAWRVGPFKCYVFNRNGGFKLNYCEYVVLNRLVNLPLS